MNPSIRPALAVVAAVLAFAAAPALAGKTLDAVKQRGSVKCGVTNGVSGFSAPDTQGNWSGLDVDTCRAIAAAVLGDEELRRHQKDDGDEGDDGDREMNDGAGGAGDHEEATTRGRAPSAYSSSASYASRAAYAAAFSR